MSLSSLLCGFPERIVASQSGFRAFTMPFLRSTELLFSSACFESSIHLYRCYMSISQEFIALFERVRKVAELIKRARFFYWCLCGIHFYFWFATPRFMCWPFFHCLKSCIFCVCVCPFHSNCCWRFKYIALSLFHFFSFVLDTVNSFLEHLNSVIWAQAVEQSEIIYQARVCFVKTNVRLKTCNYIAEREQLQSNRKHLKGSLFHRKFHVFYFRCAFAGSHFFPAEVMITYIYHGDKSQQLV